ncbi:hypothetical protein JCM3765_006925 [Sporobolomyces pararoseus]
MVDHGKIPREAIEQAWKTAGQPVVWESELKGGGQMRQVKLHGNKEIRKFVDKEITKPVEKQKKEKVKVKEKEQKEMVDKVGGKPSWEPRPFEKDLADSIVSWTQIQNFCKSKGKDDPNWFLRQILREVGPVEDLPVIAVKPTPFDKALKDKNPIYFPWPLVRSAMVQAGLRKLKQQTETLAIHSTKSKHDIRFFTASNLDELEKVLIYLGRAPTNRSGAPKIIDANGPKAVESEGKSQTYVSWSCIRKAQETYGKQLGNSILSPRKSPLAFLQHFLDISPGGIATFAVSEPTASSSSHDIYLPFDTVQLILRQQGVLATPADSPKLQARLETVLPSFTVDQLRNPELIGFQNVSQFENRLKRIRKSSRWQQSLPWLVGEPILEESQDSASKGTKRNVTAVERTKGQLLTPAPSVESTPEPVPPPLKRAKSSQIIPTVSNLSINSAPSTPTASPALTSPAPSAIVPANSPTVTEPESMADAKIAASKSFELETLRLAYETAQKEGGASFLALDVEFWERDHEVLTEFGWSVVEFVRHQNGKVTERREDQHAVIKENQRFRNGRFSPDARDHFDFGRTLVLPSGALYYLLHALFSTLSATYPLFLVFHDPRGDIRALKKLGFDANKEFERDFMQFGKKKNREGGGIWVVDTQRIFSAWLGRKSQIGLEKACTEVEVPTKRLHNAGNDAHYTLTLLERMMDRSLRPTANSALIKMLDERAAAAKRVRLAAAVKREQEEQAALKRN